MLINSQVMGAAADISCKSSERDTKRGFEASSSADTTTSTGSVRMYLLLEAGVMYRLSPSQHLSQHVCYQERNRTLNSAKVARAGQGKQ